MDAQDLFEGLELSGYPVAYRQFKSAQAPPFICYMFMDGDDFKADNQNYLAVGNFNVELYTNNKDPAAETAVETQLQALGLVWSKSEAFIDTEDMYQVLYQVQLI
jgi:hypothetical protein